MKTIHGAASFLVSSDCVSLYVTQQGGHVAPVEFLLGERRVSPYALAPWEPGEIDAEMPVLLKNLRGDFFCLPFGPQAPGPPHGATANHEWKLISQSGGEILLEMEAADVSGNILKTVTLRPGETTIYYEHRISGVGGNFSYGTHPILDLSAIEDGAGRVSVSPFRWASVYPEIFSNPADGARQALERGAVFSELAAVPAMDGNLTDLTRYPARPGSDDLVMMVSEEATREQPFGWAAVLMDGYVWFSLKNSRDFPATMLWLSNGGRSAAPWNGQHTGRLGVEDVCSHFCDGVDVSRRDLLRGHGIATSRKFSENEPVSLRNIHAVVAVPEGFGLVRSIVPEGGDGVNLTDEYGRCVEAKVDWGFLNG